jgi:PHP family Zn ribbon phosphoesterase
LRDQEFGRRPQNAVPFKKIIPLPEIIADYFDQGVQSKRVQDLFQTCIQKFGTEFFILLDASLEELKQFMPEALAHGILRVRQQQVKIVPGYDGVYGQIELFDSAEKLASKQPKLF